MSRPPYTLLVPKHRDTATIFASPHSGRDYPWGFIRNSQLDEKMIRSSEDAFVDQLYGVAPDHGAPLLSTVIPRAYVDLNRSADELDPALINGVRQKGHNPRISSGLGVIPRVVANGREIRQGKISMYQAKRRLMDYYFPYHEKLMELMAENRQKFGFALLLDCHSMPHDALPQNVHGLSEIPEVVLGDRFGASCAPELMDAVDAAYKAAGFKVSRNIPFAGAYVAQHYGRPVQGQHVIQVEIDRALYMDEANLRPHAGFPKLKAQLADVIARLADLGREDIHLAAE